MKKLIIMILLLPGVSAMTIAQDLSADLMEVLRIYEESEHLSFKTEIKVYERKNSQAITYQTSSSLQRSGKNVLLEFEGLIKIVNEKELLVVNENNKVVNYFPFKNKTMAEPEPVSVSEINLAKEFDNMLNNLETVDYSTMPNGSKHYLLKPKQGDFDAIEIFIETNSFLDKIIFHYKAATFPTMGHVVIDYLSFDNVNSIPPVEFSTAQYLEYKAEEIRLTKAFENYELSVYEN